MELTPANTTMCLAMIGCREWTHPRTGERRWYFQPGFILSRPVAAGAEKRRSQIASAMRKGTIKAWWGGPEGEESLHVEAIPDMPTFKVEFVRKACIDAVNEAAAKL